MASNWHTFTKVCYRFLEIIRCQLHTCTWDLNWLVFSMIFNGLTIANLLRLTNRAYRLVIWSLWVYYGYHCSLEPFSYKSNRNLQLLCDFVLNTRSSNGLHLDDKFISQAFNLLLDLLQTSNPNSCKTEIEHFRVSVSFFSIEDQCHFVHQKLLFWYQYIDLLVRKKLQCLWHDQMNTQPFDP